MKHHWDKERPISGWLPGGYSARNKGKVSRTHRPVLNKDKCSRCGLCWIYCPEGCIARGEVFTVDYDFCKGCGVCATECPKESITMVRENQE